MQCQEDEDKHIICKCDNCKFAFDYTAAKKLEEEFSEPCITRQIFAKLVKAITNDQLYRELRIRLDKLFNEGKLRFVNRGEMECLDYDPSSLEAKTIYVLALKYYPY